MLLFFMKMDYPSETSISWALIISSALACYVSLENEISTIVPVLLLEIRE